MLYHGMTGTSLSCAACGQSKPICCGSGFAPSPVEASRGGVFPNYCFDCCPNRAQHEADARAAPTGAACMDCGLPYDEFPLDVILPRPQWLEIHPSDGGLLCAACIVKRAALVPGVTCCHLILEVAPPRAPEGFSGVGESMRALLNRVDGRWKT